MQVLYFAGVHSANSREAAMLKGMGYFDQAVVTSVASQYLLPCGNHRMCTKVQAALILLG